MKVTVTQIALVLFLGCISLVLSAKCPNDEAIYPCMCEDDNPDFGTDLYLVCYDGNTLQKLRKVLSFFDKKSTLAVELSEMKFKVLPSDIFKGLKVKRLEISQGELDALSEEGQVPLSGLEDIIEELVITSSFTENNVPTKLDLSHLRRLKSLDLSYNVITKVGNDWFENGPKTLTSLTLSNNGIEELGDKAFANLVNLKQLWFDGNRFGEIKRSMLPRPANKLANLELDNNAWTSLPEDIFSEMPQLETLSLRTNGLTSIPQKTFESIWEQLESLDMRGNSISCDTNLAWMTRARSLANILGTCSSPPDLAGTDLLDYISKKRNLE